MKKKCMKLMISRHRQTMGICYAGNSFGAGCCYCFSSKRLLPWHLIHIHDIKIIQALCTFLYRRRKSSINSYIFWGLLSTFIILYIALFSCSEYDYSTFLYLKEKGNHVKSMNLIWLMYGPLMKAIFRQIHVNPHFQQKLHFNKQLNSIN